MSVYTLERFAIASHVGVIALKCPWFFLCRFFSFFPCVLG
jgi:hypothetical protein